MSGSLSDGIMFTIEQIELIRRLRNSGVTKEQVVQAFDSLARLDQELGPLYSVPTSVPPPTQTHRHVLTPPHQQTSTSGHLASYTDVTGSRVRAVTGHLADNLRLIRGPQHSFGLSCQNQVQERPVLKRPREEGLELDPEDNASNGSFEDEQSNASTGSRDDFSEDLREFMRLGPEKMHEEINNFIIKYYLKPGQVAAMIGLTTIQVQRYLQDYRDLPEKICQSIYSWFVAYTNTVAPTTLGPGGSNSYLTPATRVKMPDGQEVMVPHTPKRERFTFREKHLEVLESCFKDNPYPSFDQREAIAHMCNIAVSGMGSRQLNEREKVTSPVVQNWFSNRRKEIKKIAREEGVDASAALLPSRLKMRVGGDNEFSMDTEYAEQSDQPNVEAAAVSQAILSISSQAKSFSKVKKEPNETRSLEDG